MKNNLIKIFQFLNEQFPFPKIVPYNILTDTEELTFFFIFAQIYLI